VLTKTVSVHTDARYYEPTSGRFLSADPMGQAASPSLYDFAGGDPVNFFDPDGRCPGGSGGTSQTQSPFLIPVDPAPGGENPSDPNRYTPGSIEDIEDQLSILQNEIIGALDAGLTDFARQYIVAYNQLASTLENAPNSGLDPNLLGAVLANAPQLASIGPVSGGARSTVTITGGTATYYNPTGNLAADGSVYDGTGMTGAVNSVIAPLGTVMTVTGTYNGVTNTITDRMPSSSLDNGAVVDLSPAAFNALFGPGTATPSGPGRVPVVVTFPGNNGNQIINLPDMLVPAQ